MSDSLQPHGLQHARPPCPSSIPGAYSNSCPVGQWCHPTISSSVIPFFSRLQSFPASGSFPMSQLFASGGQSIRVSASASALPMNIQDWFPLGWTGWFSLQSRDSQEFCPTPQFKSINSLALSFLYSPTLTSIHDYWKNYSFGLDGPERWTELKFNKRSEHQQFVLTFDFWPLIKFELSCQLSGFHNFLLSRGVMQSVLILLVVTLGIIMYILNVS